MVLVASMESSSDTLVVDASSLRPTFQRRRKFGHSYFENRVRFLSLLMSRHHGRVVVMIMIEAERPIRRALP
jgi:hypothetical protein